MLIAEQLVVPTPEVTAKPEEVKEKSEEMGPEAKQLVNEETDTNKEYQHVVPHSQSPEIMKPSLPPELDVKEPNVKANPCSGKMRCTPDREGDQSATPPAPYYSNLQPLGHGTATTPTKLLQPPNSSSSATPPCPSTSSIAPAIVPAAATTPP
ncbi:proline-rich receptor-like protein kinase PERK7 [Malania oleifera]|uniref:proline-rich receptor-like protein kinase PERK7 n=1 Tax=Malania oleifera TaxID=397392 RepID=UPI0025ADC770|nr:proline-rich receptor-like protein kinase PERK7 [Malania oleifera]